MKPIDKFGNKIYPQTYNKMLGYSGVLKSHHYTESLRKPNLFYKHDGQAHFYSKQYTIVTFFADMRGTKEVAIWEDPSPLFYAQFTNSPPQWLQRRLAFTEFNELRICHLSFYDECEPDGLMFGEGGDGHCIVCGKDFQAEGLYCSPQCQEADKDLGKVKCRVCGKVLEYNQVIEHHLEYAENKTILVCRSCHLKIHRGAKLPRLKPIDKR
ncbi:HNH endonuclease [Patescibacteria group bacterium]|nr:HNH endonuclease [Patescibacteria group bacterium]